MRLFLMVFLLLNLFSCEDYFSDEVAGTEDKAVVFEVNCSSGQFSPDGRFIAFGGEKYKGLYIKNMETAEIIKISAEDGAGWRFSWSPDSRGISFRESITSVNSTIYRIQKRSITANVNELVGEFENSVWPPLWKDTIYSVDTVRSTNISLAIKPLSILKNSVKPMKFNAFTSFNRVSLIDLKTGALKNLEEGTHSPSISEDGRFVLYIHLDTIKVLDMVKNKTVEIGRGSSPSWADSESVVYTSTLDDGRSITYSEIRLFDMNSRVSKTIAVPADKIPLVPSISADGTKLLYTDALTGSLFVKLLTDRSRRSK